MMLTINNINIFRDPSILCDYDDIQGCSPKDRRGGRSGGVARYLTI